MNQKESDIIIQVKVLIKTIFPKAIRDFNFNNHIQQGNDSIVFMMYQNCRLCFKLLGEKDVVDAEVFEKMKLSNDGLSRITVLIEYLWEKLNLGHWKYIPAFWRYFYSSASLFKLVYLVYSFNHQEEVLSFLDDTLYVCDMGMLLGEPIFDKILAKIASKLHKLRMELLYQNKVDVVVNDIKRNEQDEEMFKSYEFPIQNFSRRYITSHLVKPSMETFLQDFLIPQKPLVLNNIIEHWPARQLWSKQYIRKVCGSRLVPIEIGSKYTSEDWTQKLMKMEDFLDHFLIDDDNDTHLQKTTSTGYLAQHELFNQIPELMKDIKIPEYCYLSEFQDDIDINSWFGPSRTISPLHTDPKNNLLCQIFGYKFIRLFAPSESEFLYPHDSSSLISNTSQLELEDVLIYEKFPLLQNAKYTDILLEPGQVLFIPTKTWHYVTSLTSSFTVSFWFK